MPGLRLPAPLALALGLLALTACGGKPDAAPPAAQAPATVGSDLTPFQLEHGIGPVTEAIQLGPVNEDMAEDGEKIFTAKCSACHKMTERYVGPPLGEVTVRRSPAFIMNQILNPEGMYNKHPEVRRLLAEYMTQMPNQAVTQEEARKIVEYLRTEAHSNAGS